MQRRESSRGDRQWKSLLLLQMKQWSTVPLRCNVTNQCEWLASLAISHTSTKHELVRAHMSDALRTCESKLTSVKLESTREYSQTNSLALATNSRVLASLASVTIFMGMSCYRINKLWCTCGMAMRRWDGYEETHCLALSQETPCVRDFFL